MSHDDAVNDARAAYLRGQDYTYAQIAEEMDCSISTAHRRVRRAYGRMPGEKATAARSRRLQELADIRVMAMAVLERPHVVIQNGKVVTVEVRQPDGSVRVSPVPDDAPVLEAIDRLLAVGRDEDRLLGTLAPSKRTVEVVTKDQLTAEMEQMLAQMGDADDARSGPR